MSSPVGDDPDRQVMVLFDFDPSTVDWPFPNQQPLPMKMSQIVQVVHDDGSGWTLGFLKGQPEVRGYFPKNYTMPLAEYHAMMKNHKEDPDLESHPEPMRIGGVFPGMGAAVGSTASPAGGHAAWAGASRPELAALAGRDPVPLTYEVGRSRLQRDMTAVPVLEDDELLAREDDILRAQQDVERELALMEEPARVAGGETSPSRVSTPPTEGVPRIDKERVRSHLPMRLQGQYLRPVSQLSQLIPRPRKVAWDGNAAYLVDMRVRASTIRMAKYMRPAELRTALTTAAANGARFPQTFRPAFNDIVNESVRSGCSPCILSELYNMDDTAREQFQRTQARDINGTLTFELQRRSNSIFYTNLDFVDVMMHHPTAWGFPDASRQVSANPGEPIDPFHGWLAQKDLDAESGIQDVDFLYTLRLRVFPEKTFQALSLGKVPEWVDPFAHPEPEDPLSFDSMPSPPPDEEESAEQQARERRKARKKFEVETSHLMAAGLNHGNEVYVQVGPDGKVKERVPGPDVLDTRTMPFRIKGLSAMRIFLRGRGNPENMKQSLITPKMVKDMAAQLGIRQNPSAYWYCLFALRYPLASDWEAVVRDDTRWYLHLPSDSLQPVHPMIKRFREHLDECLQNEFLWEFREPPVVKFKCAECGLPDSIVWCMQCTDYFCAACFFQTHRTSRGKKHWPMPIPGSRYLTASESARLRDHLPLLNVGFSNRRRFLARDNQSDKNGSRQGDTWLFFHADTFHAALQQAPEKHWFLKRLNPPRLAPGVEGYYYNFANDIVADDASNILTKAHEQKALSILQKNMRGAITRRRISRETEAVKVIQGAKRMWDVRKLHGKNGENGRVLKKWYGAYRSKQDREKLEYRMSRVQACFAGYEVRRDFHEMLLNVRRVQATFRGLIARRKFATLRNATLCIQRYYRGMIYGREPMREMHSSARKIQAVARGVARRELERHWARNAAYIEARARGMLTRLKVKRMHSSAIKIQCNWRRFQAQLDVKIMLYDRLQQVRKRRLELVREKLESAAALLIQRNWKRHHDYGRLVYVRREKFESEKRQSTLLVAIFSGAASLRHFVHPFFRHLPADIQEVLMQVKASLQRTIGLVPVCGKLANEEIGKRGLRVSNSDSLHYDQSGREDDDLATQLLLSVSRHLLPQLPAELFAPTVKWSCYTVAHTCVALSRMQNSFPKEIIPVGKDPTLPPHPGDHLSTFFEQMGVVKHHHDWLISLPEESIPLLILSGLTERQRQIYLTAQVLVTMRQALDSPSISTEDHLRFQGLDAAAGAQLMEVMSFELDHRLPLDWPKMHGTVSALANQTSVHIIEERNELGKPDKIAVEKEQKLKKDVADAIQKPGSKAKAKAGGRSAPKKGPKKSDKEEKGGGGEGGDAGGGGDAGHHLPDLPVGGVLSRFNRLAALRVVQQLGYFMVDQDRALQAVLEGSSDPNAISSNDNKNNSRGVPKQSRYISVIDKLFEMSDRAKHDHCSFVLAVVLFHMVLRALMLRVLYHRAAIAIQKRYRYLRNKRLKGSSVVPALRIQRSWRGLRTALLLAKMDDAAASIQNSWRAWRWNSRSRKLLRAALRIQRLWHSSVHRIWLRRCHASATCIQRFARGMMVRWVLDRRGRQIARETQAHLNEVMKQKKSLPESLYIARTAAFAAKGKVFLHQHRQRNIEEHLMKMFAGQSSIHRLAEKHRRLEMLGSVQPARESVFEPMIFALRRLEAKGPARMGSDTRVLALINDAQRKLNRYLPPRTTRVAPFHICSRRGRAALLARRVVKKAPRTQGFPQTMHFDDEMGLMDDSELQHWMQLQFAVR